MPEAIHAALNLLVRAFFSTLDHMGTNALIVGSGFAYAVFKMHRDYKRGGWTEVRRDWVGEAGVGLLFTMGVWFLVFAYTVVATIYQDHNDLVDRSSSLSQQISSDKETLRVETQKLKDDLATSKTQCALQAGENNMPVSIEECKYAADSSGRV